MIPVENRVFENYPGAHFGILYVENFEVVNLTDFAMVKATEIENLKKQYSHYERKTFVQTDPVCHYVRYYKSFKKTYHVLQQFESILLKDKTIPDADPLVQVLFL